MSLEKSHALNAADDLQRHLTRFNKKIEIACIPYHTGERARACLDFINKKEKENAPPLLKDLLAQWIESDASKDDYQSTFIGSLDIERAYFKGIYKNEKRLNIIAVNIDSYTSQELLELDMYRLAWHACHIDDNQSKLIKHTPHTTEKPSLKELSDSLQADLFSALTYSLVHKESFIINLAKMRAHAVLQIKTTPNISLYPFIMALDQAQFMYTQLSAKRASFVNPIASAWNASQLILNSVTQEKLRTWENFTKSAQDMIWSGIPPEVILSIAIDRNDNIETKKLGVLIASILEITPAEPKESSIYYNPFRNNADNEKMHISICTELFEELVTRCIFENNAEPFLEKADEQNALLKKGQTMGWCAAALQRSGEAFREALHSKQPPSNLTREIFKEQIKRTPWALLQKLTQEVIVMERAQTKLNEREFINFLESRVQYEIITQSLIKSRRKEIEESPENAYIIQHTKKQGEERDEQTRH